MMPPKWNPLIPGTKHTRVEFVGMLTNYAVHREFTGDKLLAAHIVRRVASFGVLSRGQIKQVLSLGAVVDQALGDEEHHGLIRKGRLSPGAMTMLLFIVRRLHRGEGIHAHMLASLEGLISPALCELLTGVTQKQFRQARKRVKDGSTYILRRVR
jgi:hypothetical protein